MLAVTPPANSGESDLIDGSDEGNEATLSTSLPPAIHPDRALDGDASQAGLSEILTRYEIPVQFLQAGTKLTPALTYRRTRTVLRTTPTGGVVAYEIEEDVG